MEPTSPPASLRDRRQEVEVQMAAARSRRWRKGAIEGEAPADSSTPKRRWSSRQLHRLGEATSHAWAGAAVLVVSIGWVVFGAFTGFGPSWQAVLTCATAVVTVVMVFAIQHLQARDQAAVQRKLDEILRALPSADNRLIAVEEAPDEELEALAELNRGDREVAAE